MTIRKNLLVYKSLEQLKTEENLYTQLPVVQNCLMHQPVLCFYILLVICVKTIIRENLY